jgi:hypothetical protein
MIGQRSIFGFSGSDFVIVLRVFSYVEDLKLNVLTGGLKTALLILSHELSANFVS